MKIVTNRHTTMAVWKLEICITASTAAHMALMKGKPVIISISHKLNTVDMQNNIAACKTLGKNALGDIALFVSCRTS